MTGLEKVWISVFMGFFWKFRDGDFCDGSVLDDRQAYVNIAS
jgi:hypothetical protein